MANYPDIPPSGTKPKSKSAVPRAKMYLRAKLGWLWGYPVNSDQSEVKWQQLYYPMPWDTENRTIQQNDVAQASVARNKMLSDFPRALPRIVGNSNNWSTQLVLKLQALRALSEGAFVDPITALLSTDIKNGERLQRQATKLCQQHPKLEPLVKGFVWWLSLDSKTLGQALQWLELEQHALSTLTEQDEDIDIVRISAVVFTLSQQIPRQTASRLLSFIMHPIWGKDDLPEQLHWLSKLRTMKLSHRYNPQKILQHLDEPPLQTTSDTQALNTQYWFEWAESLLLKTRRERRQTVDALQLLLPHELLDNWQGFQQLITHQFAQLQKTIQNLKQQLSLIDQQLELLDQRDRTLKRHIDQLSAKGSGIVTQKRELAEQRQACYQHIDQLRQQREEHLMQLDNRLDQLFCPDTTKSTGTPTDLAGEPENAGSECPHAIQALSYLPHQRNLPDLLNFCTEHFKHLQHFHRICRALQPHHDWHGPDRLLRTASYWLTLHQATEPDETHKLPTMLKSVLSYLKQAHDANQLNNRLMPWSKLLKQPQEKGRHNELEIFDYEIVVYDEGFNACDTCLKLLGELGERCALSSEMAEGFREFWHDTPHHWPQVEYFLALQENQLEVCGYLTKTDYNNLNKLLGDDHSATHFVNLTTIWQLYHKAGEEEYDEDEDELGIRSALPAAAQLTAFGCSEVVAYFQEQQNYQPLADLQPMFRQFAEMKKPIPSPPVQGAISNTTAAEEPLNQHLTYPKQLQPALAQLQRYHPQADKTAQRILNTVFPTQETLQQEISALEQHLKQYTEQHITESQPAFRQQAMEKRLENLQGRLTDTPELTPAQYGKLIQKLRHAAFTRLLSEWQRVCQQTLQQSVLERLYLAHLPDAWVQDKRKIRSLVALTTLGKPERKLASLLLQANLAGKDQDLRSLPQNHLWLERMQRAGINTDIWLSDTPFDTQVQAKNGETNTLQLRFASDVFDILQMGDHFDTCLSHDDFNFFSVVANAADLNKRVVYAYDETGRIQGRCLLGISEQKQLLSFRPYSHYHNNAFDMAIGAFIEHLEQNMSIKRSAEGKIPLLVARDWYDDGVQTIMPEYPELHSGSTFRQQLTQLASEKILEAYQQAIAPLPLNNHALKKLLEIKAIRSNTKHLLALYHQAQRMELTDIKTRHTIVAALLALNEAPEKQIWTLAKDWIYAYLLNEFGQSQSYSRPLMQLLLAQNPVLLLRLARTLIPRMQDWHCYVSDIHVFQARALLAINRPRKAEAAYHMAISKYEGGYYGINQFKPHEVKKEMAGLQFAAR